MKNITLATVKSIIKNGGATIKIDGNRVNMKSGYQVSVRDITVIPIEQFNKFILKEFLRRLSSKSEYLGVWIENGKVYIDVSRRIATKTEAVEKGKALKQISILRWRDMECINIREG